MGDPASAFGVAAGVIQLITFTSDLIGKGREIHKNASGTLVKYEDLEIITQSLAELTESIPLRTSAKSSGVATRDKIDNELHNMWRARPWRVVDDPRKSLERSDMELSRLVKECREVSFQLLEVLEDLKVEGRHKRWASFRQALISVWKEDKIDELSDRLEGYRRQIDTTLLMSLREQIRIKNVGFGEGSRDASKEVLGMISDTRRWQAEIIDSLQKNDWKSLSPEFSSRLSATTKQERERLARSRILETLRFRDMRVRYEDVADAHEETFEWAFSELDPFFPPLDDEDYPVSSARPPSSVNEVDDLGAGIRRVETRKHWDSYLEWLRSDSGIYWITGKPGAGKSTLMKFLSENERTSRNLETWRGTKPLLRASFFFWNSGTPMQMSRMGLLRTVLYNLIRDHDTWIPTLFPDRWRHYELFGGDTREWTWAELTTAFETLLSDQSNNFFLLIDGLDEFDGSYQELAEFIVSKSSAPNVKLCVASRPLNEFEDEFKHSPSLRMEELTKPDILKFVSDKLSSHDHFIKLQDFQPEEAHDLITKITEKAQGVFLWVRIAVQSLLDGLRDGDRLQDLYVRLEQLPKPLEELFRKILGTLDVSHRMQTVKIFQLVQAAAEPLPLITLELAEGACVDGPDSGLEKALAAQTNPMKPEEMAYKADNMRRRLNSRCKCLLGVPTFQTDGPTARVQFLHRTVRDFLASIDIREVLATEADTPFDPDVSLISASLYRVKTLDPVSPTCFQDLGIAGRQLIRQYGKAEKRRSTIDVSVLVDLERTASALVQLKSNTGRTWQQRLQARFPFSVSPHWTIACCEYEDLRDGDPVLTKSFLEYVCRHRIRSYAVHAIESGLVSSSYTDENDLLMVAAKWADLDLFTLILEHVEQPSSGWDKGCISACKDDSTRKVMAERIEKNREQYPLHSPQRHQGVREARMEVLRKSIRERFNRHFKS